MSPDSKPGTTKRERRLGSETKPRTVRRKAQKAQDAARAAAAAPSGAGRRLAKDDAARTLVVEQYASVNGTPRPQRLVVRSLGLRRLGARVSLPDSPSVRGMVRKVPHLVRIVTGS